MVLINNLFQVLNILIRFINEKILSTKNVNHELPDVLGHLVSLKLFLGYRNMSQQCGYKKSSLLRVIDTRDLI